MLQPNSERHWGRPNPCLISANTGTNNHQNRCNPKGSFKSPGLDTGALDIDQPNLSLDLVETDKATLTGPGADPLDFVPGGPTFQV